MRKIVIQGGKPLNGRIYVSGSKNSAVGIIPAVLLVNGPCVLDNVPEIRGVFLLFDILRSLGGQVERLEKSTYRIDCSAVSPDAVPDVEAVRKMRASYYVIGALLGRFGRAKVGLPGGCDFGDRPIDLHIKGFEALGAKVDVDLEKREISAHADCLLPASIYFDTASVGATINVMLAAVGVHGKVTIENAAREPHVVDVANFLNAMGADIKGAGTNIIRITGGMPLTGSRYEVVPDQIEAGTYMVAAAAAGGRVEICNVIPKHLESITAKLQETGIDVQELDDSVIVTRFNRPTAVNIRTQPYPGFPTDMQPQFSAFLALADGESVVTEGVYRQRFRYTEQLAKMGACFDVDGNICTVRGVEKLQGARLTACDLRAGVAMVIAGLSAEGTTEISEITHIERGYENIEEKLKGIGANFRIYDDDAPDRESAL